MEDLINRMQENFLSVMIVLLKWSYKWNAIPKRRGIWKSSSFRNFTMLKKGRQAKIKASTNKAKKSKQDDVDVNENDARRNNNQIREPIHLNISICGHPRAIDLYMRKVRYYWYALNIYTFRAQS